MAVAVAVMDAAAAGQNTQTLLEEVCRRGAPDAVVAATYLLESCGAVCTPAMVVAACACPLNTRLLTALLCSRVDADLWVDAAIQDVANEGAAEALLPYLNTQRWQALLERAIRNGRVEIVHIVVGHGVADVITQQALRLAAAQDDSCLHMLIDAGAEPEDDAAMIAACVAGRAYNVKVLLRGYLHETNWDAVMTAAIQRGSHRTCEPLRLILKHAPVTLHILRHAILMRNMPALRLLLPKAEGVGKDDVVELLRAAKAAGLPQATVLLLRTFRAQCREINIAFDWRWLIDTAEVVTEAAAVFGAKAIQSFVTSGNMALCGSCDGVDVSDVVWCAWRYDECGGLAYLLRTRPALVQSWGSRKNVQRYWYNATSRGEMVTPTMLQCLRDLLAHGVTWTRYVFDVAAEGGNEDVMHLLWSDAITPRSVQAFVRETTPARLRRFLTLHKRALAGSVDRALERNKYRILSPRRACAWFASVRRSGIL